MFNGKSGRLTEQRGFIPFRSGHVNQKRITFTSQSRMFAVGLRKQKCELKMLDKIQKDKIVTEA